MTDNLTKLYAGLTDKERGKMAYAYLLKGDDLELKRIESTMPEQHFIGLPMAYRRMHVDLTNLTMSYAIAYWQQVANCLTMMAGTMASLQEDDPTAYKPMMKRFKEEEAVLLSIEQAFDDVCLEHGLDTGTMRKMAGTQLYQVAHPDLATDDADVVGYRAAFENVLAV